MIAKVKREQPDCPPLSEALIQHLQARFPERSPSPRETLDELRHRGGQASVIRYLTEQYERQNEVVHLTDHGPYFNDDED